MKKVGGLIVASAALLLVSVLPAEAQRGRTGFQSQPFRGGGHSGHGHGHHHGHHHHSKAFIGVGIGFAPAWWWWGYPAYYPYPTYPAPVVVQQSPPVYVQQEAPAEPYYWYYCEGAQAYYPYVQQCPAGWMKVVPPANSPKPE